MRVAVVGASGFIGSHLVPHLVEAGHEVIALARQGGQDHGRPEMVHPRAADVVTGDGLAAALAGVAAIVHLVAIPRESRGRTFEAVNVGGVRNVLAAAREVGVSRIVHLSALGVVDDPSLGFLRSKWAGEQLVRASSLDWTVLRPSLLFGKGDGFFNLIDTTLRWWSPGIVAIPGDGSARFQPLSVEDLAIAILASLDDPQHIGKVHEIGGPAYLTYREIVEQVMRVTGRRRLAVNVPIPLISAITAVTDRLLPVFPVTHDQIGSLRTNNFTSLEAFEGAFGVRPRPLDLSYLRH